MKDNNPFLRALIAATFVLSIPKALIAAADNNTVYRELLDQGIDLSNGKTIKLQEPEMQDGLTWNAQQSVLDKLGPKNNKKKLTEFIRGDANDWYVINQASEKGSKDDDSIGRLVDLYFVAKGKFATVANPSFIKQQLQQNKQNKIENYSDDKLEARKLSVRTDPNFIDKFTHGKLDPDDLFGKVQVEGSTYGIETIKPTSLLIAFKLDPRFNKDPDYPNQYQTAKADQNGKVTLGPIKRYVGFGGYAKITKLESPEDKIFVEYHLVFDEPHDWFNGATTLTSKLETNYTENVRKFRRDLK